MSVSSLGHASQLSAEHKVFEELSQRKQVNVLALYSDVFRIATMESVVL